MLQPTCGDELECLERFGDIGVCLSDSDYLCLKDDEILSDSISCISCQTPNVFLR